ncbi:MAG: class I adenylate-forming enzyme family protein [Phycisphaerae bacterium]
MLLEQIFRQTKARPHQTAIVDDKRQYTYRDIGIGANLLADIVDDLAAGADRIGLLIPQSGAFAFAFLGTRLTGRIVVPLNYLLKPNELVDVARAADLTAVITIHHFDALAEALKAAGLKVFFIDDLKPSNFRCVLKTFFPRKLPPRKPDDVAVILFTSGTSSSPKGVMLTNNNLDSNARDAVAHARFNDHMCFLGVLPMFHTLGLMACFLIPLSLGCRVVYQARFSPPTVLAAIDENNIEVLIAVPTMYALLANSKSTKADSLKKVKYAISGGEPLPVALIQRYADFFGLQLLEGFGLTETSPIVALSVPWANKRGAVGKILPNQQVRLVDDNGHDLGPNQDGELWIKGPNVMKGYYKNPTATSEVLTADGWFKTGDIARLDNEGFLSITGRKKEMIIMAGEKIAPSEIEDCLRHHPAVLLAAVIGVKDEGRGEVPVAFVQLEPGLSQKPGVNDLRAFVRQNLAAFKVPRDVYFVDEMPRSPTGKVLKRALVVPHNTSV